MKINNHLSMHRMLLLHKQYVHLHIKQTLIIIGATIVAIAGFHTFMHLINLERLERSFNTNYHQSIFLFAFEKKLLLLEYFSKDYSQAFMQTISANSKSRLFVGYEAKKD